MHNAKDLLFSLYSKGVYVWTEGGRIGARACRGQMLPEDLDQLRSLKAEIIELLEKASTGSGLPLRPRPSGCSIPLTSTQLATWNYLKDSGMMSRRMCVTSVRVRGPLDISCLQNSIKAVVRRHESLRTRFVTDHGLPRQHVEEECGDHLEVVDISHVALSESENHVRRLAEEFVEDEVNLSVGPLFAAKLFRLSPVEHVLTLALDHIISDGVSNAILGREILTVYRQAIQGLPISLPSLSVQFPDYAVWQNQTRDGWSAEHGEYLKRHLSGAPELQFPSDSHATKAENPIGVRLQCLLGNTLSQGLRNVARREQTLLATVVLTAYVAVVSRWCNQRDFLVLFESNGRTRPELESMIGCLAGSLYLRVEMEPNDCLLDLLKRIHLELCAAYDHQRIDTAPDIVPGCSRTDVYFNWQSPFSAFTDLQAEAPSDLTIEPFSVVRKPVPFRFGSFFFDSAAGITWSVEYRPDLLVESTVDWFGHHLRLFAEELVQRPLTRLASVPMNV